MTILPITLTMAGAAAIINVWLALRCLRLRYKYRVELGDGGEEPMTRTMRAHSNFTEYTPLFLVLLGLVELGTPNVAPTWLWIVGAVFILGRVSHALGMDRPAPNPLRMFGAMSAFILTLGMGIYAVYLPHGAAGSVTEAARGTPGAAMADAEVVPSE